MGVLTPIDTHNNVAHHYFNFIRPIQPTNNIILTHRVEPNTNTNNLNINRRISGLW